MTQVVLAQMLFVSEKTISKWECGNGFPDTSLILPLCEVLDISANELLSARELSSTKEYRETAEKNLIALKNQQERSNKNLLMIEILLIYFAIVVFLGSVLIASYTNIATIWKVLLTVFGTINLIAILVISIIIETKIGYYQCENCHHKYIPSYKQVICSMHMGRTRYMKCPHCHKKSWHKKHSTLD